MRRGSLTALYLRWDKGTWVRRGTVWVDPKDRNDLPFTFYQKVNVGPDISRIWVRYWNIRFIYTITSSSDQYKACGLPVSATSAATLNC